MELTKLTKALIHDLQKPNRDILRGDRIGISRTISAAALLYEKFRTAIEYREDHLLRRAAIERILKRRLFLNANGRNLAEPLLKEILWAKYIPEETVTSSYIPQIQQVIDKYIFIRNEVCKGRKGGESEQLNKWLISICASEIEELLVEHSERDAFINYLYQYFRTRVIFTDQSEQTKDIQVYIAIHRGFAKSDNDYIRFAIFKLSFDNLSSMRWVDMKDQITRIYTLLFDIQKHLTNPLGTPLNKKIKKEIVPFRVLRDLYESEKPKFEINISTEEHLHEKTDNICRTKYVEIGKRLRTAAIRSVIYVFLTKMVVVILLEYPLTIFLGQPIHYLPLGINVLFPPLLMALSLIGISAPGADNTNRIIKRLGIVIYNDEKELPYIKIGKKSAAKKPFLWFFFTLLYFLTFILVFGGIYYILQLLNFPIISVFIFMFFVSVILFFAYRVRQIKNEYLVSDREGLFEPILSFILLPILSVGKILSTEFAKINFLLAIVDFIIEAPFKAIFEVFEEWFQFMRQKKDEIL